MKKARKTESQIKRDRDGLIRCRICGCTERDACADMCSWVEDDLCSTCHRIREQLAIYAGVARRLTWASLRRLVNEAHAII